MHYPGSVDISTRSSPIQQDGINTRLRIVPLSSRAYLNESLPGQGSPAIGSKPYLWKFDRTQGQTVIFKQPFYPESNSTRGRWRAWVDDRTATKWYIENVVPFYDDAGKNDAPEFDFETPTPPSKPRKDIRMGEGHDLKPGIYYVFVMLHRIGPEPKDNSDAKDFFKEDVHFDLQPVD